MPPGGRSQACLTAKPATRDAPDRARPTASGAWLGRARRPQTDRGSQRRAGRVARLDEPQALQLGDLLLDSLTTHFTEGYALAAPARQHAVRAFRRHDLSAEDGAAPTSGSPRSKRPRCGTTRAGPSCRPVTSNCPAASLVAELDAVCEATRTALAPYAALTLAAWRGREREIADLLEAELGGDHRAR